MSKTHYPSYCYDDNFVLRVSPLLWLMIVCSVNHVLILCLAAFANSADVLAMAIEYAYDPYILMSNVPGALVLLAAVNRRPAAGERIRRLWRNGRVLLIVGLCAQIAVIAALRWKKVVNMDESLLANLAANAVFLVLLLGSKFIKDIFSDFPQPPAAKEQ